MGVRTRHWATFSPFCKFIAPQGMLMLQNLCDHAVWCGYTPLATFLDENSWANLMCLDEQSCMIVIGAAQNYAVAADVHGVNACVSKLAGNTVRQGRLPAPACRELFEPRPAPRPAPRSAPRSAPAPAPAPRPGNEAPVSVIYNDGGPSGPSGGPSDTSSSGLSDSDGSDDSSGGGGEPKESPDAFLVRIHIRHLGIDGKDAHRLGERARAIGRRSFLRAVKELALERPSKSTTALALSRIFTRYEC
jgi:hypothetical protein